MPQRLLSCCLGREEFGEIVTLNLEDCALRFAELISVELPFYFRVEDIDYVMRLVTRTSVDNADRELYLRFLSNCGGVVNQMELLDVSMYVLYNGPSLK